jgi:hypothetical protein
MAYFTLRLDTVGPASPTIDIGGTYTANRLITANIGTGDATTTGYGMKFWGDIDPEWAKANGILPAGSSATSVSEVEALWLSYATSRQLQLSTGDGLKNVFMQLRDSVHNQSSQVSDSITLDATLPTVTIVNGKADVDELAVTTDRNTANFSFYSSEDFVEFRVCYVASGGATQDQGIAIGTAGGSLNTAGTGTYTANTNYNVTLKGADIQTANSGDGNKGIKVFVRDSSGQWSA